MQLKRYKELYNEHIDSHSRGLKPTNLVEDPEVSLPDYLPFLSLSCCIYGPEFPTFYFVLLLYGIHKL